MILFPAADGPLKLPNIGFDNENHLTSYITLQQRNNLSTKAKVTMSTPVGKKNL